MQEFDKLIKIVEQLRDRKNGCPWDIKQTHQSLVPNFIEELYESVEAIEKNDFPHLSEELGDLMLHIIMQTQIAKEENHFQIEDVLKKINEKLIRRHPHIFGTDKIANASAVKKNWERIKLEEKKSRRESAIDGIPKKMPALIIAQRMQEKAAAVGFDWDEVSSAMEKLKEEIVEFENELASQKKEEMKQELGDMLFSIVNISRKLGFDSESVLKKTIHKFESRFKKVETYFRENEKNMLEANLEQLDEIWEIVKKDESKK